MKLRLWIWVAKMLSWVEALLDGSEQGRRLRGSPMWLRKLRGAAFDRANRLNGVIPMCE
jgi:hypothetical protein